MTKEDKPDAWMPLYIGDWDGDTSDLSCEEDGAYMRLIRRYWRTGPLADDDANLARIVRMEIRQWRKIRPAIAHYFTIADGVWRNKRADAELARWSEKKIKAVEKARAAASKRWGNDASSNAPSISQALLEQCPSSSSREVEPIDGSTLSGRKTKFLGPEEVRAAFVSAKGEAWTRSYIDPCGWQDLPERALIPANTYAGDKIRREARSVLVEQSLIVAPQRASA